MIYNEWAHANRYSKIIERGKINLDKNVALAKKIRAPLKIPLTPLS